MKKFCIVYISEKGYLCESQIESNNRKEVLDIFNRIKNKGDEIIYVCPKTCKITKKDILPILVTIDKIADVVIELKNNQ